MPLRRTMPWALLLCASAASGSPFEATLSLQFFGTEVLFTGSGNGYNTPAVVTLPGGTFTGTASETSSKTQVVVKLSPGGSGSFAGSPLAGPMPLRGVLSVKVGSATAVMPLNSGNDLEAFGVGGSTWAPVSDGTLRGRFQPWSAGMATPPKPLGVAHGSVNTRYSGSDARTPGGRGQITLVSPAMVSFDASLNTVLLGTLQVNFVPEPGAPLLLGTGAALLCTLARRRSARPRAG